MDTHTDSRHWLVVVCYLCTLEGQLDLDVTRLLANPQVHLVSVVQYHHIVICQIILTEVGTFLRDGEITFLVGTAEQSRIPHVLCMEIVLLATSDANPEEVCWFFAFVDNLNAM